jgi:hypothetical protein
MGITGGFSNLSDGPKTLTLRFLRHTHILNLFKELCKRVLRSHLLRRLLLIQLREQASRALPFRLIDFPATATWWDTRQDQKFLVSFRKKCGDLRPIFERACADGLPEASVILE